VKPSLYAYQVKAVAALIQAMKWHGAALDGSDTGTGKTFAACAAAEALGLPVCVICPKAVRLDWVRVLGLFGVTPLFVENYERMSRGNTGQGKWLTKKKANFVWSVNLPENTLMIWDEVHRVKSYKSLNARMLRDSHRAGFKNLMLSATAAETPLDMKTIGYVLGLHDYQEYHWWCLDMGCTGTFGALEFRDATPGALDKLHRAIYEGRGYRVRIEDLPPGEFPENAVIVQDFDFGDEGKIAKIYAGMEKEMDALDEKESGDAGGSALTIELRARQRAELLKVMLLEEKTNDLLEEGKSVALFVNFNQTVDALVERFPGCSVVRGGQKDDDRAEEIERFQLNTARVIVINSMAGGTGVNLHDLHGGYPRVSLICPSYDGRVLKQVLGRIRRKNGLSKCLQIICVAAGTIEEKVIKAANLKMNRLNEVNDGASPVSDTHDQLTLVNQEFALTGPQPGGVIDIEVTVVRETPEERPHAKRGPSSLKMYEKCPRYVPNDGDSEAAARGTALHLCMETDDWAPITDPVEVGLLRKTQGFLDAVFTKNGKPAEDHREIRLVIDLKLPSHFLAEDREVFGTCDRFLVYGTMAIMVDYKFGFRMVDHPRKNRQTHAYVLGAFDRFPQLDSITFFFLTPRQDSVTYHTFYRSDMKWMREDLAGIIIDAVNPKSPHKPGSDLCEFCELNLTGKCPAIFARGRELALKYDGSLALPDILHGSQITDPAMMAQALMIAPILEAWAQGVRRSAKSMSQEEKLHIPGYRLAVQPGPREIIAPKRAYALVKDQLTPEEFAACTEISVTKLFDAYKDKFPKGKKKAALEELENQLLDQGLLERGNSRIFVTRDHSPAALPEKRE